MPTSAGGDTTAHHIQRARPLLGTLVTLQVQPEQTAGPAGLDSQHIHAVMEKAFGVIHDIERAMTAHCPDSDLGRLARVLPGEQIVVSHHTVAVLRLAKYWQRTSLGAFDPVRAANRLAARDMRPAYRGLAPTGPATLHDLCIVGDDTVQLQHALRLDLGGIAKGYAVDQAISTLVAGGLANALVNAGGDLRAAGEWGWPVQVRSASMPTHARNLKGLRVVRNAALATSTGATTNAEFVRTARVRSSHCWNSCTVHAPDCVTADALTKWGLQSDAKSPRLERILRAHRASMWRT